MNPYINVHVLMDDNDHHPYIVSIHASQEGARKARADEIDRRFSEYANGLREEFETWKKTPKPEHPPVKYESIPMDREEADKYFEYMDSPEYEAEQEAIQEYKYDLYNWERKERKFENFSIDELLDSYSENINYDLYIREHEIEQ